MECGSIAHAYRVFSSVSSIKDIFSWMGMIAELLTTHGLRNEVVYLFFADVRYWHEVGSYRTH